MRAWQENIGTHSGQSKIWSIETHHEAIQIPARKDRDHRIITSNSLLFGCVTFRDSQSLQTPGSAPRNHFWQGSGDSMQCQGLNWGWLHIKQSFKLCTISPASSFDHDPRIFSLLALVGLGDRKSRPLPNLPHQPLPSSPGESQKDFAWIAYNISVSPCLEEAFFPLVRGWGGAHSSHFLMVCEPHGTPVCHPCSEIQLEKNPGLIVWNICALHPSQYLRLWRTYSWAFSQVLFSIKRKQNHITVKETYRLWIEHYLTAAFSNPPPKWRCHFLLSFAV